MTTRVVCFTLTKLDIKTPTVLPAGETNPGFETSAIRIFVGNFNEGERGDRGGTVVKVLCYKLVSVGGFFIGIKSFRSHYGPGVNSACNRNEYQEHFNLSTNKCTYNFT